MKHLFLRRIVRTNFQGVTLIELILVMALFAMLSALGSFSLFRAHRSTSVSSAVDMFIANLKQQQIKAMVGDTEGEAVTVDYGIHFDAHSYTLFRGSSYSESAQGNLKVDLPPTMELTYFLPGVSTDQIIFYKGDGEIFSSCTNGVSCRIIFQDLTNNNLAKNIRINKYGVIVTID
jgi:prepilin-type N-terminal cleavage/methylation domain-containing protein